VAGGRKDSTRSFLITGGDFWGLGKGANEALRLLRVEQLYWALVKVGFPTRVAVTRNVKIFVEFRAVQQEVAQVGPTGGDLRNLVLGVADRLAEARFCLLKLPDGHKTFFLVRIYFF
jgi:hypothetical protein